MRELSLRRVNTTNGIILSILFFLIFLFLFLLVFKDLFLKDPIKMIPYLLDFELRDDREEIAKKIIAKYFKKERGYEDQLVELEQVLT